MNSQRFGPSGPESIPRRPVNMSFRKMLLLVFLAGTFVSAQSNSIDGLHSPANALGLPPNIIHPRDYPSLSDKEIGHIRRMIELANLPPGDWGGMGSSWFEMPERTLCYQLEFMTYALASAQYNVTPAYHDVYRDTMDKFIQKLLLPDVWRSWANVSRGGELMDPDQKAMREGWIDPVRKDNVMYSGHVLEMTALYEVLYRTGKYDKPGSISFRFSESTWGPGPQVYKYDVHSMAKLLHDEFQESDYVGIACEPNLIFTACNQLPVLGFILHDYLYGTHYAAEVIPKFKAKWVSEHYVDPQTQSVMAFRMKTQQKNIYGSSAWQDGWAGMFMHAWDPTYIESIYPSQKQNHLPSLFTPQMSLVGSLKRDWGSRSLQLWLLRLEMRRW